jgi:hypothetical protein
MRAWVGILIFLPILVSAQEVRSVSSRNEVLHHYLTLYTESSGEKPASTDDLVSFVQKLEHKRGSFRDEKAFLSFLFNKTHQRFLKNYTDYASFNVLLRQGTYNCLTGTALYALLLNYFNVDFRIIETNYHIFLIADTGEGNVLFEATDPVKGFVEDPAEIEKRISTYRLNTIHQVNAGKTYYRFNFELYNEVNLDGMLGLLHYNLAIVSYNKRQFATTISHLDQAISRYQSPRIEEFSRVVLLSVMESGLEASVKESYVREIQAIRKRGITTVVAARR